MSIISKLKCALAPYLFPPYRKFIKSFKESVSNSPELGQKIGRSTLWTIFHLYKDNVIYGANSEDYLAFEFHKKSASEKNTFLTTGRNWYKFTPRMVSQRAMTIFNNKDVFSALFQKLMKREWIKADSDNIDKCREFITRHGRVIAKPTGGAEGFGIFMVSKDDESAINRLFDEIKAGGVFVLEELIVQHTDMNKLNPSSVNTIRVETTIDKKGCTHITNTICIIGSGGGIINNAHNGGVMCHVDIETGVISSWARNPKGAFLLRHPDTGIIFPGYKIPMWHEVLKFAEELSHIVPDARYIGWDIAITPNGPVVIEGNTYPGHCTQACDMIGRWPLLKSLM